MNLVPPTGGGLSRTWISWHGRNIGAIAAATGALLCAHPAAAAADGSVTISIGGTVAAYASVVVVPEMWNFHLEGRFRAVSADFEYRDPGYAPGQFYVLVSSNAPVRLSPDFGQVVVGGTSYGAVLRFGLPQENAGRLLEEICLVAEQQGCGVYESTGPVTNVRIDLVDLRLVAGEPLPAGDLRGFLQLTIAPY